MKGVLQSEVEYQGSENCDYQPQRCASPSEINEKKKRAEDRDYQSVACPEKISRS